ncbi:hypothetical protein [Dickeya lacustris]|uniref:Uncharacterized protein n=1 Tax=Dickeya lacustris TaxID=2259638 RepID=A0ABY8G4F2_9GAMM|nr:hypothetical protein [Dickeya lacustris]WFN54819.1 hypothetical protein O1Q98_14320 [Dickeya lacustris]
MNWWQELSPEPDNNTHRPLRKRPGNNRMAQKIDLFFKNQSSKITSSSATPLAGLPLLYRYFAAILLRLCRYSG